MAGEIRLGTSSSTAEGWNGAFYPKGMKSADYIRYYSSRFDTIEVDSTFYRCPTIEAVNNWALKTPPGFIFSLKIPQTITHQKILVDCQKEFEEFVSTVEVLGEKLGPMVFQFPYFSKGPGQALPQSEFRNNLLHHRRNCRIQGDGALEPHKNGEPDRTT